MALGSSDLGVAQMGEQNGQVPTGVLPISSGTFPPVSVGGSPPLANGRTEAKVTCLVVEEPFSLTGLVLRFLLHSEPQGPEPGVFHL